MGILVIVLLIPIVLYYASDEQDQSLQVVLNQCHQKKIGGVMDAINLVYFNDTHTINNHTCEWRLYEGKIAQTDPDLSMIDN